MNVFDVALEMERESQEQYEKRAATAAKRELANLYSLLADSEREHYDHLMHLKEGKDPDTVNSVALERIRTRMPEMVSAITADDLPKDDDGYGAVVRAEEESILLYQKLAEQEPNESAAAVLRMIAEEERKHLEVIENIYEFVEAPRTYLEWREFSNLGQL